MSFFNDLFGTAKDIITLPYNVVRNPSSGLGTVNNTIGNAFGNIKGLTSSIPGVNNISNNIPGSSIILGAPPKLGSGFKTLPISTPVGRPINTSAITNLLNNNSTNTNTGTNTGTVNTPPPPPPPTTNNNNNPYITYTTPETPQGTNTQPQAPNYTSTSNPYANATTDTTSGGSGSYIPPTIYATDQTNTNSTGSTMDYTQIAIYGGIGLLLVLLLS